MGKGTCGRHYPVLLLTGTGAASACGLEKKRACVADVLMIVITDTALQYSSRVLRIHLVELPYM